MTTFKHLIICDDNTAKFTFDSSVRPYLNKREYFYVIKLKQHIVGFAYRCTRQDLWQELYNLGCSNRNRDGSYPTYSIEISALWPDGCRYIIGLEEF